MPALLSGGVLRTGSANTFITLASAQPQLPATPTTSTGYTIITQTVYPAELVTSYASSLGNINFNNGLMQGNLPNLNITIAGTGTGTVIVTGSAVNTNSNTGVLVVKGGVGISDGIYTGKDINVNSLTIGQGYRNTIGGVNNIVITGTAEPQINAFPVGQQNLNIGYSSLQHIDTAYKVIALGRYAVSTGTQLQNTIAIGDSALMKIGSTQTQFVGTISQLISVNTLTIQVTNHSLITGTQITISGVQGMVQLNGRIFYVNAISSSTLKLYEDINLQTGVDASTYDAYTGGGSVRSTLLWNGNFAIGSNAGRNLINGEENFFLGLDPAVNFTTGSYNFFMGHSIAQNMKTGNANISIGGDNMVDGKDNQVNIGSVFYYNGSGYLELNADTGLGIGTESTSSVTGAFNVLGGAGITGNLYVGGQLHVPNTTRAISSTTGALVVAGGAAVQGDMYVSGTLYANALFAAVSGTSSATEKIAANATTASTYFLGMTSSQSGYTSISSPSTIVYNGATGALIIADTLSVTNATSATSAVTGAFQVTGGVGVQGSIYSADGNPLKNNLLYTPKVTITNTGLPPLNPNPGDFWIDTTILAELQFIQDGTNTFWIQISSL